MRRVYSAAGNVVLLVLWVGVSGAGGRQPALPSGTPIKVRLSEQLETDKTESGQAFSATVAESVVVIGRTVIAKGAKVEGKVIEAVSSGRLKKPASITLELARVAGISVRTDPIRIDEKSHRLRNVELIGGGAGAGAIIGGVVGGKKGAAIGAAVGAGAGTATAYLTGKKEIVLPAEMPLTFVAAAGESKKVDSSTSKTSAKSSESSESLRDEEGEAGESEESESAEGLRFSEHDLRVIRRFFESNTANLPPGLAKRGGNLPPGLERQLRRNGSLPPGLQKRVEPFPRELEVKLPRLPGGYVRVILGNRALILDSANKILDLADIQ